MNSYIPLKELAEMTGMSYPLIKKVRSQGKWLGCALDIREVQAQGRQGGVGYEINVHSLPEKFKIKVLAALGGSISPAETPQKIIKKDVKTAVKDNLKTSKTENKAKKLSYSPESLWAAWSVATETKRARAEERLVAIKEIEKLVAEGVKKKDAIGQVASKSRAAVYTWYEQIEGIEIADWLPALLPSNYGRLAATDSYHPAIYETYKAYWLTKLQRSHAHCYQLTKVDAAREGWGEMPSLYMLKSRIEKEINQQVQDYMRIGENAKSFQNPIPAQKRNKSLLVALEEVNGDGYDHEFYVVFPDGTERKPVTWFWQDVYSGLLLSYYTDVSENSDMLRLALRETIKNYGLGVNGKPYKIIVDNTRAASARALTGRATHRHRYALRPDEPIGIFGRLGCEYRPTLPYRGQAKPIERKFGIGGISELVDKHPMVEGARNAGKGITWEQFQTILKEGVETINNRVCRSTICGGIKTPRQVFEESIAQNVILKATEKQLNMLMMCAIGVPAHKENGSVKFMDNTYWTEELTKYCGEKVMIEYDPQHLHEGVNVYTLQGLYITTAPCTHSVGWADTDAAREQLKLVRRRRKSIKEAAKAEVEIGALERAKRNIQQTPVGLVDVTTGEIMDYKPEKPMSEQKVVGIDFKKKINGLTAEQEAKYAENMARRRANLKKHAL
jgi:hypothetical protein